MQQPINSNFQNTEDKYYNPINKIKSLIQNLDAELVQLCNKCAIPRSALAIKSSGAIIPGSNQSAYLQSLNSVKTSKSLKSIQSRSMATMNPKLSMMDSQLPTSVQARTLSSIYRARVIDAYRNRRIFTVYGNYHTIRRGLLRRGWLEKLAPGRYPKLQGLPEDVLLQHARRGNDYEAVAISKIIHHFPAFFIWQPKGYKDAYGDVLPYRNRVRRARQLDFSTKIGLIGCAEQEQWVRQAGVCAMSYPRFYRLGGSQEERLAFIEEFRLTQCCCLLRRLVQKVKVPEEIIGEDGSIMPSVINFALLKTRKQLGEWEHISLDELSTPETESDTEWQHFMEQSNNFLHNEAKFKASVKTIVELGKAAKSVLDRIEARRPDYRWDGFRNLWILKPGYQCRGIGIVIRNNLDDILNWANTNANRRYLAQKYIERPLLIYKTKFDIRQYMLVTIGETIVSIWLYRDCYLRFSSQEFSVDDLRESIHLTNNSVQKKYRNKQTRDPRLPKNNMWSLEQFKVYLKHQNLPESTWNNVVFEGFKENLIAVVMASFEETDFVENAFEMYGCDFMLDEHFNPILIEVNSTPDLSPSTEVTARLCPMTLKDLIKVVVDLPRNSRATTGQFELIHQVEYKTKKNVEVATDFEVSGKSITLCKPIRQPFRAKVFKKPMKMIKRAEAAVKFPIKTMKKARFTPRTREILNQHAVTPDNGRPLKAVTKEALAMRYTQPK